ncbi:MAG: adenosine deaminase [Opitutales bacterium]
MPYTADPDLAAFVQQLPKTETHLHIEGALPFELLQAQDPEKYPEPPPMWADDFRYHSFDQFMELYVQYAASFFTSPQRYHEVCKIILGNCVAQNVRYAEISFHSGVIGAMGGPDYGPPVLEAIHAAAPEGLELRVFMGMSHQVDAEPFGLETVQAGIHWDLLAGIDLHGPEYWPIEPWTLELWPAARVAGKFTKAHAGEFMPASFVRTCVETLGAQRIQHGVRAAEDPAVLQLLTDRGIACDVCPISNVKLAVEGIDSMAAHPLPHMLEAGVTCTINSDDPFMFGNRLSEEYYAVHQDLGFSRTQLARLARNGFEIALMPAAQKAPFLAELDAIIGSGDAD